MQTYAMLQKKKNETLDLFVIFMQENLSKSYTPKQWAAKFSEKYPDNFIPPDFLKRNFMLRFEKPLHSYFKQLRMMEAKRLIEEDIMSLKQIADLFDITISSLSKMYKQVHGETISKTRNRLNGQN